MKAKERYKDSNGNDIVFAGMTWVHDSFWCEKCGWKDEVPELGNLLVKQMEKINAGGKS